MSIKVGINGLGRIGRNVLRHVVESDEFQLIGVNDTSTPENIRYLLNHDSIHGEPEFTVQASNNRLHIDGRAISYSQTRDPSEIDWEEPEITFECTGAFRRPEQALKHRENGTEKIIISAPSKGENSDKSPSIVYGVNEDDYQGEDVVDCASCTTNALANMLDPINQNYNIKSAMANTVHAYTGSQNLVDGSNSKIERGRAAAENIVPTSTGAAEAIFDIMPSLKGKIDAVATRVPVPNGSLVDLNLAIKEQTTRKEINQLYEEFSRDKEILGFSEDPKASSDINTTEESVIIDANRTRVEKNMIKIMGWYDNEYAYAKRMLDVARVVDGSH